MKTAPALIEWKTPNSALTWYNSAAPSMNRSRLLSLTCCNLTFFSNILVRHCLRWLSISSSHHLKAATYSSAWFLTNNIYILFYVSFCSFWNFKNTSVQQEQTRWIHEIQQLASSCFSLRMHAGFSCIFGYCRHQYFYFFEFFTFYHF